MNKEKNWEYRTWKYDDYGNTVELRPCTDDGIYTGTTITNNPTVTYPGTDPYTSTSSDSTNWGWETVPSRDIQVDKLKIDWDDFKGIEIKVGEETIIITKEKILDALAKLFPELTSKFAVAMIEKLMKEGVLC